MIAALRFEVNENYNAFIYPAGSYNDVDWGNGQSCSLGSDFLSYKFKKPKDGALGITIATGSDGTDVIRFTETKRYTIKINSKSGIKNALLFFARPKCTKLQVRNVHLCMYILYIVAVVRYYPDTLQTFRF